MFSFLVLEIFETIQMTLAYKKYSNVEHISYLKVSCAYIVTVICSLFNFLFTFTFLFLILLFFISNLTFSFLDFSSFYRLFWFFTINGNLSHHVSFKYFIQSQLFLFKDCYVPILNSQT